MYLKHCSIKDEALFLPAVQERYRNVKTLDTLLNGSYKQINKLKLSKNLQNRHLLLYTNIDQTLIAQSVEL